MIRIEATTYSESVISTPSLERSPSSGPIQNGTTYMVRPRMAPANRPLRVSRISWGSTQWLVGPALSGDSLQMKVRSSTRATSAGSEAHQKEFGFFSSSSLRKVPASTSAPVIRSHSASEPSAHTTRSGVASSATSPTHFSRRALVVGA